MIFVKISALLVLFSLACFFESSSGRQLKRREATDQTPQTTVTPTTTGSTSKLDSATSESGKTDSTTSNSDETETEGEDSASEEPEETDPTFDSDEDDYDYIFRPFSWWRWINDYFRSLDRNLSRAITEWIDQAKEDPNAVSNTTSQEVMIGGRKYNVTKSIIRNKNDSSIATLMFISSEQENRNEENATDVKK